jgi:signal transduction histidine kinase
VKDGEERFAAFAHDVKTPLAVVRGYAELLANNANEETLAQAPDAILEAAEQLGPALDDLLLALEIASGFLEPDWERFDLASLVPHSNGMAAAVLGDKRLLQRALTALSHDGNGAQLGSADGFATIRTDAPQSRRRLYVAGLIAELHGGELRETPDGVLFTVPLAT